MGGEGGDLIRGMVQLQHKGIKAISNVEKKLAEAEHGVQERLGYDQNLLKDAVSSVPWKTENLDIMEMYESKGQTYRPSDDVFVFSQAQINARIRARNRYRLVLEAAA
jgi:hypothetical protein